MQVQGNPYFNRKPIKAAVYFRNRQKETLKLLEAVKREQCVSLVGPRKIGKTSLLFWLHRLNEDETLGVNQGYVYVYVDGQAHRGTDTSEFYSDVLEQAYTILGDRQDVDLPAQRSQLNMRSARFRRAVQSLMRQGIRLVFLIDEFDAMTANVSFDLAFFSVLRSLATEGVVYVTASKRSLSELNFDRKVLGSPFFNYFNDIYVGLFDMDSAFKLIREPAGECIDLFDEPTVNEISRLAGGHPFFLQRVCYEAFELCRAREGGLSEADLEQLYDRSYWGLEAQMARFWTGLAPQHQRILLKIADGGGTQQGQEAVYRELTRQCLLVESSGRYRVFSVLFADYVRAQPLAELPNVEVVQEQVGGSQVPAERTDSVAGEPQSELPSVEKAYDQVGESQASPEQIDSVLREPYPERQRMETWLDRFENKQVVKRDARLTVYKAYERGARRHVIIKVFELPFDAQDRQADVLRRELDATAELEYPSILPMSYSLQGKQAYVVTQHISGGTLADRLRAEGVLELGEAVQIVISIGRAVAYAHQHGVAHRNIKPSSVFIAESGRLLLGNFGLTLEPKDVTLEGSDQAGVSAGTVPGTSAGATEVEKQADIRALGLLLSRLLVDDDPYLEQLTRRRRGAFLDTLSEDSRIPECILRVIEGVTELDPQVRYPTMDDIVRDLSRAYVTYQSVERLRRRLPLWITILVIATAVWTLLFFPLGQFSFVITFVFIGIVSVLLLIWLILNSGWGKERIVSLWDAVKGTMESSKSHRRDGSARTDWS